MMPRMLPTPCFICRRPGATRAIGCSLCDTCETLTGDPPAHVSAEHAERIRDRYWGRRVFPREAA